MKWTVHIRAYPSLVRSPRVYSFLSGELKKIMKYISVVEVEIRSGHVPKINRVLLFGITCFVRSSLLRSYFFHLPMFLYSGASFLLCLYPFSFAPLIFKCFFFASPSLACYIFLLYAFTHEK